TLTRQVLQPIIDEAIVHWRAAGASPEAIEVLKRVDVEVDDLPDSYLGLASPNLVRIDQDASGYGWFVDATPVDNEEFRQSDGGVLRAPAGSPAFGKVDLLTVVEHELGHILGLAHSAAFHDVMSEALEPGIRELPDPADIGLVVHRSARAPQPLDKPSAQEIGPISSGDTRSDAEAYAVENGKANRVHILDALLASSHGKQVARRAFILDRPAHSANT